MSPTAPHDDVPLLRPAATGVARRAADRLGNLHPAAVYAITYPAGLVLLTLLTIGVGLLLVHVLLPEGLRNLDGRFPRWLAEHRTPGRTDWSEWGSLIGDSPVLPALILIGMAIALALKRGRVAAFLGGAGVAELIVYRITTLSVHRERPGTGRLDPQLPVDQSFPSGHTGASVAVYCAIMLVVASRWPRLRVLWPIAVALPVIVALSRMYRGMHHPIDTIAGALVGVGCIALALVATRAAIAARERRES